MNPYVEKTSKFVFVRDPQEERLIGPDGGKYYDEQEAFYYSLVGSCGCGSPEDQHQLIIDCLKCFEGDEGVDGIKRIVSEKPHQVAEFIAHYLNGEYLLEHGGGVYGSWLTDRGKQFIEAGRLDDHDY